MRSGGRPFPLCVWFCLSAVGGYWAGDDFPPEPYHLPFSSCGCGVPAGLMGCMPRVPSFHCVPVFLVPGHHQMLLQGCLHLPPGVGISGELPSPGSIGRRCRSVVLPPPVGIGGHLLHLEHFPSVYAAIWSLCFCKLLRTALPSVLLRARVCL